MFFKFIHIVYYYYNFFYLSILVIEVAIGEYGTDVLVKLADTSKITYIKDHNNCHLISGDQELQLENGAFTLYLL